MKKAIYFSVAILLLLAPGEVLRLQGQNAPADKASIETLYKAFDKGFNDKDVGAIMACYAPSVFVFDAIPPRQYPDRDAYKKDWEGCLRRFPAL